ncbi:MAG: hypothetical protein JWP11_3667 [Frankiales bacterium]|nr:hypothetical protein [Frankiales bacterium]
MGLFDRLRTPKAQPIEGVDLPAHGPRAMTAAAARIDITDRSEGARLAPRQAWQADAWVYRDAIGEVRFGLDWLGDIKSRLRLFIGVVLSPDEEPVGAVEATTPPVDSSGQPTGEPAAVTDLPPELLRDAAEALLALGGGGGAVGHGHLLKPLTINMNVAGECYLVGTQDPETLLEEWQIRSMDEVERRSDGTWWLRDAPGNGSSMVSGGTELPENSYVARMWNPHPRWRSLPDSPMRGILGSCEGLLLAERRSRVRDRARLSRGVLLVANEIEFTDAKGRPTDFQSNLQAAMVSAVADESSASSLVPTVVRVAADRIKDGTAMQHVDVIDKDDEQREADKAARYLGRIVRGLDVPPEVIEGLGDVKFANAVAIDSTGFRYHVEPGAQRDVDGLTIAYLWPRLESLGHDTELVRRLVIWYEPSAVVSNPNRLPDAMQLHERQAVSDAYLREAAGVSDDFAPSDEELLRRTGLRGQVDSALTYALLRLLTADSDLVLPVPADSHGSGGTTVDGGTAEDGPAALPSGETQQPEAVAAAATPAGRVTARWSETTLQLDLDLRARLEAACDAAMRRALERAGARVVSRISNGHDFRALVAGVPSGQVTATLGADRVRALGVDPDQLLSGAFSDLASTFTTWATATFEQALEASCDLLGVPYYPPGSEEALAAAADPRGTTDIAFSDLGGIDQVAARNRFATDVAAAADGLVADLTDTARGRLFDPPTIPGQGEYDPNLTVDRSSIRRAVARAGGADSSPTHGGISPLGQAVNPDDGDPGLLATGRTLTEALAAAGVPMYALRWEYGNSPRPFPPHKALAGLVFADQQDTALAVAPEHSAWLTATTYAPGDHRGCGCQYARLVEDPFAGMTPSQAQSVRARQQTRDVHGRFVDVTAA